MYLWIIYCTIFRYGVGLSVCFFIAILFIFIILLHVLIVSSLYFSYKYIYTPHPPTTTCNESRSAVHHRAVNCQYKVGLDLIAMGWIKLLNIEMIRTTTSLRLYHKEHIIFYSHQKPHWKKMGKRRKKIINFHNKRA